MRHGASAIPHGVVDDGNLVLLIVSCPLLIKVDNHANVLAPNHAVAWAHHAQRQVHGKNLLELAGHHHAERGENVGIVFLCLVEHLRHVDAVVVERLGGIVLPEAVIAEENVLAVHVGKHGVGPVEHGRFDECERALAYVECVACLHCHEVPVLVIVSLDDSLALGGAIDGHIGDEAHELG